MLNWEGACQTLHILLYCLSHKLWRSHIEYRPRNALCRAEPRNKHQRDHPTDLTETESLPRLTATRLSGCLARPISRSRYSRDILYLSHVSLSPKLCRFTAGR